MYQKYIFIDDLQFQDNSFCVKNDFTCRLINKFANSKNSKFNAKMDNKFKNSFIVVIVISLVVIIKIALKESIRENALNEIEKTYTPSNNSPSLNTLPVSDELPPSPSVSPAESIPAESTTANNTEIETEEI